MSLLRVRRIYTYLQKNARLLPIIFIITTNNAEGNATIGEVKWEVAKTTPKEEFFIPTCECQTCKWMISVACPPKFQSEHKTMKIFHGLTIKFKKTIFISLLPIWPKPKQNWNTRIHRKLDHVLKFTFYLINTSIDIARLCASLNPQTATDIYLQINSPWSKKTPQVIHLHRKNSKTN